jgi:hypothetical protein
MKTKTIWKRAEFGKGRGGREEAGQGTKGGQNRRVGLTKRSAVSVPAERGKWPTARGGRGGGGRGGGGRGRGWVQHQGAAQQPAGRGEVEEVVVVDP